MMLLLRLLIFLLLLFAGNPASQKSGFAAAEDDLYQDAVYYSSDDGNTWNPLKVNAQSNRSRDFSNTIFVLSQNNDIFAKAQGVLRSTDNGRSWTEAGLEDKEINSLAISPDGVLFADTFGDGIFRSFDNGKTWASIGAQDIHINLFSFSPKGDVLGGGEYTVEGGLEYAIFYSTDNGGNWQRVNWQGALNKGLRVKSLVVDANGDIFAGVPEGRLLKKLDNGRWAQSGDIFPGGIYLSRDNGNTWVQVLQNTGVNCLLLDKNGDILAGAKQGIFRTSDNGRTWVKIGLNMPIEIKSIATNRKGHIFAGTQGGGIFRSLDNANTWFQIAFNEKTINSIFIFPNGDIFAVPYKNTNVLEE